MSSESSISPPATSRFQFHRQLGSGGMGVVYLATDRDTGQRVAVKTMKTVDPTALFRFKQEFRVLSELVHPHLVKLHELINENDRWFLVMELVEGAVNFHEYLLGRGGDTDTIPLEDSSNPHGMPAVSTTMATASMADPSSVTRQKTRITSEEKSLEGKPPEEVPSASAEVTLDVEPASTTGSPQLESIPSHSHKSVARELGPASSSEVSETRVASQVESATAPTLVGGEPRATSDDVFVVTSAQHEQPESFVPHPGKVQAKPDRLRLGFRQLVSGVRGLHRAGMLHRDLKPANALVSNKGNVVLLDFGLVAELSQQRHLVNESRGIAGTIDFMSPEQASAQELTEASDWYSVGVMLFQALTGTLPFLGPPMQRLQAKTLRSSPRPRDVLPTVDPELDEFCCRLLARQPHDRPAGVEVARFFGVEEEFDETSTVSDRALFVGRETQLEQMSAAFQQVLQGQPVVLRIHGRSGAGKSTLIQQFLEPLASHRRASVLTGKCYELETVPFKGVDSLIDSLAVYLRRFGPQVTYLLPPHITALARIFPVLKRVDRINELCQSLPETSDLKELRAQAFEAFRELISRISMAGPLILHLDDLQWGDVDSAALISTLILGERPPRILLIVSYRSEYAEESICLKTLLNAERKAVSKNRTATKRDRVELTHESDATRSDPESESSRNVWVGSGHTPESASSSSSSMAVSEVEWCEVQVDALSAKELRILADKLLQSNVPNRNEAISKIVEQSAGSAYLANELARHWNTGSDLKSVKGQQLDDVLWDHLCKLPDEARRIMEVIAVAGRPTPLREIVAAAGLETVTPRTLAILRNNRLIRSSGPGMQAELEAFHDRVRETLFTHLDATSIRQHHRRLAETMERFGSTQPDAVALHFEGAGELECASRYYGLAATQALQKLAFDQAEGFARQAVQFAQSDEDKADGHERLIHFYTDMARFSEAYAQGRAAAAEFGVSLPAGFFPPGLIADFVSAKWRLRNRKTASLVDLPVMQNRRMALAVRMINAAAKAAYQVRPELCVAISTRAVNLCLKYGNTTDCAIVWMVFGAIFQGGVLGNHPVGYEFGRLALSIVDRYQQERQRPEVTFVVGYFGTSWMMPARSAEALWQTTITAGKEVGDLFHTGCASAATVQSLLMRGVPLRDVWSESDRYLKFLRSVNLREPIGAIRSVRQLIRNLTGKTSDPDSFSGSSFDEAVFIEELKSYGSRHFAHYYFVNKMLSLYLWNRLELAIEVAATSTRYLKESPGMLHSAEHFFLLGLISAAMASSKTGWNRWRTIRTLKQCVRKFQRWALRCEENFAAKRDLLMAELARVSGDSSRVIPLFQDATRLAKQFGQHQVEAIAYRQAAVWYGQIGDRDNAKLNSQEAERCFMEWGAISHLNSHPTGEKSH